MAVASASGRCTRAVKPAVMATNASSERVRWTGHRRVFSTDGKPRAIAGETRSSTNICRKNRIRSEEHTSELQSLMRISYAVFCLKKKKKKKRTQSRIRD